MKTVLCFLVFPLALIGCAKEQSPQPVTAAPTSTTTATPAITGTPGTTGTTLTHAVATDDSGGGQVLVAKPPPALRPEKQPVAPDPDDIWVAGRWRWTGTRYEWVSGAWVTRPNPTATWIAGHWFRRPGGWVWIAGRWQ
jgi:hypothetical protein